MSPRFCLCLVCPLSGWRQRTAWLSPGATSSPSPTGGTRGKRPFSPERKLCSGLRFPKPSPAPDRAAPARRQPHPLVPRAVGAGRGGSLAGAAMPVTRPGAVSLHRPRLTVWGVCLWWGRERLPDLHGWARICSRFEHWSLSLCSGLTTPALPAVSQMRKQAQRGQFPALGPPACRSWAGTQGQVPPTQPGSSWRGRAAAPCAAQPRGGVSRPRGRHGAPA